MVVTCAFLHVWGDMNIYTEASLCQWWMPFIRPSSEHMTMNQQALSPERPELTCRCSPLVQTNSLFKTIFQVQIYWLIALNLLADVLSPGRPEWMCRCFLVSVMNALYKIIHKAILLTWQALYPLDLNNECTGISLPQCHWQTAFSRPSYP